MKRIGLAASKIAKGNIWFYHIVVVILALLFSLFLFLICGFSIAVTLFVLSLLAQRFLSWGNQQVWVDMFRTCLTFLGVLIGIAALAAVLKNVKLKI